MTTFEDQLDKSLKKAESECDGILKAKSKEIDG